MADALRDVRRVADASFSAFRRFADLPWPLAILTLAALVVFRNWYFSTGDLTFGDWRTVQPRSVAQNFPLGPVWMANQRLGFAEPIFYQFYNAFALLYKLGASFGLAERVLFFWFFPPLLVVGTYLLVREIVGVRVAAATAAMVALFNSDILSSAIGGHTNATNAIACFPWIVLGMLRFARGGNVAWLGVVAIAAAIQSAFDLRWSPPSLVLGLALTLALPPVSAQRQWLLSLAGSTIGVVSGVIIANAHWILPRLVGVRIPLAPPNGNLDPQWVVNSSVISPFDALALNNPYFVNQFNHAPLLFEHAPGWFAIIPVIGLFALAVSFRSRVAWAGAVTYLVGAFLCKGALPPLGDLYLWMFNHVPTFDAYRDPSKFAFVALFGYVILIGAGIRTLALRHAFFGNLAAAVLTIVALATSAHAFDPKNEGVLMPRHIPIAYERVNNLIAADSTWGRVLWLPITARWADPTIMHPAVDGYDVGAAEFLNWTRGVGRDRRYLEIVDTPLFDHLARAAAIRYVVVALDAETDATIGGLGDSLVDLVGAMRRQPGFEEIGRDGNLVVFRARFPTPPVTVAKAASLVRGSMMAMQAAALFPATLATPPYIYADDLPPSTVPTSPNAFARVLELDRTGGQPILGDGLPHDALGELSRPALAYSGPLRYDRIVAAPAVWAGRSFADTTIEAPGPAAGTYDVAIARGPGSLAGAGVGAETHDPAFAGGALPYGATLLQSAVDPAVRFLDTGGRQLDLASRMSSIAVLENAVPATVRVHLHGSCRAGTLILYIGGVPITSSTSRTDLQFDALPGRTTIGIQSRQECPDLAFDATLMRGRVPAGMRWMRLPVPSTPLWSRPIGDIDASRVDERRERVVSLLELRGPDNRNYVVAGPALSVSPEKPHPDGTQRTLPRGFDVRAQVYNTLVSPENQPHELAIADGYDALRVESLDVVDLAADVTPGAVVRSMRVTAEGSGISTSHGVDVVPSSSYTVEGAATARDQHAIAVTFEHSATTVLDLNHLLDRTVSLTRLDGSRIEGTVVDDDTRALTVLTGAFASARTIAVPWRDVRDVAPVDGAVVAIPLGVRDCTVAVNVSSTAQDLRFTAVAVLRTGDGRRAYAVQQPDMEMPSEGGSAAKLRIATASVAQDAGLPSTARLEQLVIIASVAKPEKAIPDIPILNTPVTVRVSDALLVSPSGGTPRPAVVQIAGRTLIPGRSVVKDGNLMSLPAGADTPLAVRFGAGPSPAPTESRSQAVWSGPDTVAVHIPKPTRWMYFSERYDPQWELRDASGRSVGTHFVGEGFGNAWFMEAGFQGSYRLVYVADGPARISAAIGLLAFLALVLWVALRARRGALRFEPLAKIAAR